MYLYEFVELSVVSCLGRVKRLWPPSLGKLIYGVGNAELSVNPWCMVRVLTTLIALVRPSPVLGQQLLHCPATWQPAEAHHSSCTTNLPLIALSPRSPAFPPKARV
jgi:hypothetical protein